LFPPVGPPRRDDADGVAACRERDVQQDAVHRAQHNEPRFAVVSSVVFEDNTLLALECPYDPSEIDANEKAPGREAPAPTEACGR
jgi:hypothetical protein